MAQILDEIQDGSFAKEWILENQAGRPVYNALKRMDEEHLIEEVGAELRQQGKQARCATLKLRYSDFTTITRRCTLRQTIDAD